MTTALPVADPAPKAPVRSYGRTVRLERHPGNPVLAARPENRWERQHVSNAAAVLHDGRVHLLYRAESDEPRPGCESWFIARIGHAASDDGFTFAERGDRPALDLDEPGLDVLLEVNGVEDARVSRIGDTYYIVYVVTSRAWDRLALATTRDFATYEKHGLVMPDLAQRTGGLFPERIGGRFWLLHRPIPNLWLSETEDFRTFSRSRILLRTTDIPWGEEKLGLGAPPIRTDNAWALIIHGKDRHRVYRLGIMWLDLEDPGKVLGVQREPILEPETAYETAGFVPNVVYACGAVVKNGRVIVYYGCADTVLAAATMEEGALRFPG